MKLKEIANEIYQYLKKFENNKNINKPNKWGLTPYYYVNCYCGNKYVYIVYVSFQGKSKLTIEEAIKYLNWLEKGNIGTHYEAIK